MKKRTIITIGIILFIVVDIIVAIQILGNNTDKNIKESKKQKNEVINNEAEIADKTNSSLKEVLGVPNITVSNSDLDNQVDAKIVTMNEGTRIKSYCAKFFDAIEYGDYDEAYGMLNDNFKSKYFNNNKEDFIQYVKRIYPSGTIVLQYKNIDQKGEIYEVKILVTDDENKDYKALEQTLVIRENEINDFKISFSIN